MSKIIEYYSLPDKTFYRIVDDEVVFQHKYDHHPMLIFDKKNCCLFDMSDIEYIAVNKVSV